MVANSDMTERLNNNNITKANLNIYCTEPVSKSFMNSYNPLDNFMKLVLSFVLICR